jgi:Flp pilus assembly protein TadG
MMRTKSAIATRSTEFKRDARGNVALLFGLSLVPLMLVLGVAFDTARLVHGRTRIAAAMDAGALAAATSLNLSPAAREKLATETYLANLPPKLLSANSALPVFVIKKELVIGTVDATMDTSLMGLAGIETVDLGITSEVGVQEQKKAEIALVLDYSYSMTERVGGEVKFVAMRNAAISLIDSLVSVDKDHVKVGLVPFSHHVMAPLPASAFTGAANGTACTKDRPYPANLEGDFEDNTTKWQNLSSTDAWCKQYAAKNLIVRPLTDNFGALKSQLRAMLPLNMTHIALGAEYGFHVLSPQAPFTGGSEYDDETTKKFLVILTDGKQTEPAKGPNGSLSVANGEKNLVSICAKAKAKGIEVVTIAYDLSDSATRANLQSCASASDMAFVADDNRDLAAAFETIKSMLVTQLYLKK